MKKLLIIILLVCVGGGVWLTYKHLHQQVLLTEKVKQNSRQQGLHVPTGTDHKNTAGPVANPETPYILSILGQSKELSEQQKLAMDSWRNDIVKLAGQHPGTVFINGPKNSKKVALTFDDGPDNVCTPQISDILKEYQVTGNFFFKGQRINKCPNVVRRAASDGNLVLSHTFNHLELDRHTPAEIDNEIIQSEKVLDNLLGNVPAMIRPPFGTVNETIIKEAEKNNVIIILWSIDTLDWSQKESPNIAQNVLDNVRPGDIILMHSDEDKQATVEALPAIIEGLQDKGYSIVGLDELLNIDAYK